MKTHSKLETTLFAAAAVALGASWAAADVTIEFQQSSYNTGQIAELTIDADPGTLVFLLLSPSEQETVVPGVGTFCVGFDAIAVNLAYAPESSMLVTCGFDCDSPIAGVPYYAQAVTLAATGEICISNCDVLNIVADGSCDPTGCTPGYWKNHEETWAPTGYSPDDDFAAIFGVDPIEGACCLAEALVPDDNDLQPQTLPSHAVAALLNSSHPDENFAFSPLQVIAMVATAIASGDVAEMEAVKDLLDEVNNTGCAF